MTNEEAPENTNPRSWGKLERPGVRRKLIHELARGEKTQMQLAREYGVVNSSITEFKQRHTDRIAEVAQALEDEFAGLWVAQKVDRLDQLQDLYEAADAGDLDRIRAKVDILRKAAEELGQIPQRTTIVQAQPLEVRLVGVDTEQL
ncbi:hypothetical protein ABZ307_28385 [Streptomyces griseorubiginosus]|uniref:hypothetical protein n=1 Tax=Streptomyces griseorubiginosus TaxID=67304 RepID=UPI0033A7DD2F